MDTTKIPFVSAVISTRDRGALVAKTVRSLLVNEYPDFEVIIVDQSRDNATEVALQPFLSNPRLRYFRTQTKGVSNGRNLGIKHAKGEFVAITDDDAELPAAWLRELINAFQIDPKIGIVFGNVLAAPHDVNAGFIPDYTLNQPFLARNLRENRRLGGLSVCMGIRKSVWQHLKGFDPMLGAGGLLKSGAETDFTVRTLLTGYFVYETPQVVLIHHGFRSWKEGRQLIHRYWYGTGAMFMKHIRCGHWSVIPLFFQMAWRWAFARPVIGVGRHSHKWLRLVSFLQGLIKGGIVPLNKTISQYSFHE